MSGCFIFLILVPCPRTNFSLQRVEFIGKREEGKKRGRKNKEEKKRCQEKFVCLKGDLAKAKKLEFAMWRSEA